MIEDDRREPIWEVEHAPSRSSVGHFPSGKWRFDGSVACCIGDMMARSIPGYGEMRALVRRLTRKLLPDDGTMIELGAGDGIELVPIVIERPRGRFYAVENAPAMLGALRDRFSEMRTKVSIVDRDLAVEQADRVRARDYAHVIAAVLVLQFVPIEARRRLVREAYDALKPGGAILLVEKVLIWNRQLRRLIENEHHEIKHENGYSYREILAKEKALEGVLIPSDHESNEWMLKEAGFYTECFWRNLNFAGWIGLKPAEGE